MDGRTDRRTNGQTMDGETDRWTDGQKDESDFVGCCPTSVEPPKRKKEAANELLKKCNKFIEFVFTEKSGTIKPSIHYLLAK